MNDLKYSSVWDLQLYLKLLIRGEYLTKRMENVLWEYTMAVQQRLRIIVLLFNSQNSHGPHQKKTIRACWPLDVSWRQYQTTCCKHCHSNSNMKRHSVYLPPSVEPRSGTLWLSFCSLHQKGSFEDSASSPLILQQNCGDNFKDVQRWLQRCLW